MKRAEKIRTEVTSFYVQNAIGLTAADAFPAWWLHVRFELPPQDAVAHASDGSHDKGLDAFHVAPDGSNGPELHIVQAKFTESRSYVRSAVKGFEPTMQFLRDRLAGQPASVPLDNRVLMALAGALDAHVDLLPKLRLRFEVLHLCEEDPEVLASHVDAAREWFKDAAAAYFPDHVAHLSFAGPDELLPDHEPPVHLPAAPKYLTFDGVRVTAPRFTECYVGLGRLAELVELYREYGDHLFSKNVRHFGIRRVDEGPARHMRDALRRMCIPSKQGDLEPVEHFAMSHNGVTLYARSVNLVEGRLDLRAPSVLNGCQTVKNAFLFRTDSKTRDRIAQDRWTAVPIPLRVVVSPDEAFVRAVAINNNRQKEIRTSAFHANDPIHLRLADRFEQAGIYYERQQDAFANLRISEAAHFEESYPNSLDAPLRMEELAQVIACVGDKPALSVAARVSSLFEDSMHDVIFQEHHLEDLELLVFLRNVFSVLHLVMRDAKADTMRFQGITANSFKYPMMRVLARWVVKKEPSELISEWGACVLRKAGPNHPLRVRLGKLLTHHHTGLQQLIPRYWADPHRESGWRQAHDPDAIAQVLRKLRLDGVDVFAERRR